MDEHHQRLDLVQHLAENEPLGVAPFILAAQSYPEMPAAELRLELHPQAQATVFPALGAYVGGDIVAGMYSGIASARPM